MKNIFNKIVKELNSEESFDSDTSTGILAIVTLVLFIVTFVACNL